MSIRRSLAWTFSGQIATFLISFVGSVIIARLLSPRELGVYALAVATAGLITVVATLGLSAYLIREVELSEQRRATAFTVNAIINLALSLAILAFSFALPKYFDDDSVGPVLRLLAIPPLVGIFEFLPSTMVQREMQFKARSLILMAATLLSTTITVLLAAKGFSSMSMPYAAVAVSIFRAVLFSVVVPHHVSLKVSLKDWRQILVFGLRMITVSGAAQLAQRASEIVLGMLLGLTALGIYSRASNLASLIFSNVYGTATNVIFAQLSKTFRETGAIRETYLRGLEMILALMWPLVVGLAVLARPAINIIYGPKWGEAALPLSLLMFAQFVTLSFGMNWELFVIRDETAKQTKYETIRSLIGLVFFAAGSMINLGAATLGRVLEALVGAVIYLPKMTKLSDARPHELTKIYVKSAGLTVAAVAPSVAIMIAYGWSATTPRPIVALGVATGVILWLAALRYSRHPLLDEILRVIYFRGSFSQV
jgi:O-antigen/teichoic acid export membrane protein